ncbi:hypothetical protein [Pedobacter frigiditerrae]|uniref:hypothetical protein n=1 Tax=Pedobacter frigiditerrae TaxID=2530452 RepID=UPI00292E5943|nr:hypothetical protein [Pedobacter frigiditerrae]
MKRSLLKLSVIALLFASCAKDTTTTETSLKYSFNAINLSSTLSTTASASGVVVAAGTNGSINWTGVSVNVSKIEFSASHTGTNTAVVVQNFTNVNALKPDSLSGKIDLKAGVYEKIQFKLTMTESATNPPFILTGTYTEASGTKIPVIVQLNQSKLISLEVARLEVDKGVYIAKVTLELNALVKGLVASDFGQTTRIGADNKIVVNSTTNRALYEKLTARLSSVAGISITKQ